jgi:aflatoxin B1 aldehyde reductase
MSNYSATEVEAAVNICKANGWLAPSIYQGNYNVLNRDVETELLPMLKKLGIRFLAYNPLAAGLLTGQHKPAATTDLVPPPPDSGRFGGNQNYIDRYWKQQSFQTISELQAECDTVGCSMVSAAFSWLLVHSALDGTKGDGVVLGASSIEQLQQNLTACRDAATLPQSLVHAMDRGWERSRKDAFRYYRGESGAGGDASVGISFAK